MRETSVPAECDPQGAPELSCPGVALGYSGSGNGKYRSSVPMVGPMGILAPRLGFFDQLRSLSAASRIKPRCELHALLRIAGVVIAVSGCPSLAFAEGEEATGEDAVRDSIQSPLSIDSVINFAYYYNDNNKSGSLKDPRQFKYNQPYSGPEFINYDIEKMTTATGHPYNLGSSSTLDDVSIPAAVWSLDVSTGVHLDHVSSDPDSDLSIAFGSHRRISDWTREIFGIWTDKNSDWPRELSLSSLQFQVASCGGDSAEHRDLDHCILDENSIVQGNDPSKQTTQNNGSVTAKESNSTSTSGQGAYPAGVLDLSPLAPASFNNFGMQGSILSGSIIDECYDNYALCANSRTTPPTILSDSQIASIGGDGLAPPIDDQISTVDDPTQPDSSSSYPITTVIDSEPILPIVSTNPITSTVPETSTELMTVIGFGIIVLCSRRRAFDSFKQRLAGKFGKMTKSPFYPFAA